MQNESQSVHGTVLAFSFPIRGEMEALWGGWQPGSVAWPPPLIARGAICGEGCPAFATSPTFPEYEEALPRAQGEHRRQRGRPQEGIALALRPPLERLIPLPGLISPRPEAGVVGK
jgi:hypothetical protein